MSGTKNTVELGLVKEFFPKRAPGANKYDCGRLLLLAGQPGMAGAAKLAACAASRSGCGLVQLMTDERLFDTVSAALTVQLTGFYQTDWENIGDYGQITPEGMDVVMRASSRATAAAAGCGWGCGKDRFELILKLAETGLPLLLDADALNSCAGKLARLTAASKGPVVMTPHTGEFSRLCGLSCAAIENDRASCAEKFAAENGVVLVLKGAESVITDGRRTLFNRTGTSGMAKGGSGDVLTGVCGAMLAQKVPPLEAAALSAWCCGKAGELASEKYGTTFCDAQDTIESLSEVFKAVEK